jgi:hypothetical protein
MNNKNHNRELLLFLESQFMNILRISFFCLLVSMGRDANKNAVEKLSRFNLKHYFEIWIVSRGNCRNFMGLPQYSFRLFTVQFKFSANLFFFLFIL